MLDANNIIANQMLQVKRHLKITWSDTDTDNQIKDMMLDAEAALNHKLGTEFDYFKPGQARRLYLDYILYAWNDCLNEFDKAYMSEIYQLRHIVEVRANEK